MIVCSNSLQISTRGFWQRLLLDVRDREYCPQAHIIGIVRVLEDVKQCDVALRRLGAHGNGSDIGELLRRWRWSRVTFEI